MQARTRLVIIGNGMVGHKLIETLVASAAVHQFELVTFCEEPRYAYDRVHLSEFFNGKTAQDLSLVAEASAAFGTTKSSDRSRRGIKWLKSRQRDRC